MSSMDVILKQLRRGGRFPLALQSHCLSLTVTRSLDFKTYFGNCEDVGLNDERNVGRKWIISSKPVAVGNWISPRPYKSHPACQSFASAGCVYAVHYKLQRLEKTSPVLFARSEMLKFDGCVFFWALFKRGAGGLQTWRFSDALWRSENVVTEQQNGLKPTAWHVNDSE